MMLFSSPCAHLCSLLCLHNGRFDAPAYIWGLGMGPMDQPIRSLPPVSNTGGAGIGDWCVNGAFYVYGSVWGYHFHTVSPPS